MKHKLLITIFTLLSALIWAQESEITIHTTDQEEGKGIPFCHVCIRDLGTDKTDYFLTDEQGKAKFAFSGKAVISISFMGYNGLLFGIMYGFASLIPVVGGIIMWLPFMLFEFYSGNSSNAIFIALYSIIVISIIADTFIKPLIIKEINSRLLDEDDTKINELVIFFAIIAGLATFGFWGMILGPAITAFFLTIMKLFEERTNECKLKSD